MPGADAAESLRDRLVRALRDRLAQADPAHVPAMRRHFEVLAEDYDTLALMDELPEHADAAHTAWRGLVPDAPEPVARQRLLEVLASAYRRSLTPPAD